MDQNQDSLVLLPTVVLRGCVTQAESSTGSGLHFPCLENEMLELSDKAELKGSLGSG